MSDENKNQGTTKETITPKEGDHQKPRETSLEMKQLKDQLAEATRIAQEQAKALENYKKQEREEEERKLTDQKKWQEVAKAKEQEKEQLAKKLAAMEAEQVKNTRVKALMKEVGSVRNEDYLIFANLDMIDVVDGKVDEKSVKLVAEDFQRKYPDLIGSKSRSSSNSNAAQPPQETGDKIPDMSIKANRDAALATLTLK